MTKEELKLEALKYLENFQDCAKCKHRWGDCADELDEDCLINNCYSATPKEQDIYLAGAEPRERRIEELEKENKVLAQNLEDTEILNKAYEKRFNDLEKENAELRKVAEFQQSSNISRYFENKKLKEGLAVGSTFNKTLNSLNKTLEEERDKYRNMVFDKDNQLTKAKEIIKTFLGFAETFGYSPSMDRFITEAEQFLKDCEVEK